MDPFVGDRAIADQSLERFRADRELTVERLAIRRRDAERARERYVPHVAERRRIRILAREHRILRGELLLLGGEVVESVAFDDANVDYRIVGLEQPSVGEIAR